jgi:hypothetical protein
MLAGVLQGVPHQLLESSLGDLDCLGASTTARRTTI